METTNKNIKLKPSGIEWIGDVPEDWGNVHIKCTAACKDGFFIDGDWIESKDLAGDSGSIRYLTSGNVGVINYKEQGDGYITEDKFKELSCTEVLPGDILISRLNEPIGRACIVPYLGQRIVCAVDNVIFRPDSSLYDRRYLVYQMNCKAYSDYTNCLARGTGMHRISRGMLGQISILVPPLAVQTRIATYLDTKCSQIDDLVQARESQIMLLRELKQTIITDAVTGKTDCRNLPNNTERTTKPSGIEWIGDVPEDWEVKKIKFVGTICSGDSISNNEIMDEGNYEVYGGNGLCGYAEKYNVSDDKIIIGRVGALCGNIHISKGKRFITDNALIFSITDGTKIDFLSYLMVIADFNKLNTSSAQPLITGSKVMNVKIPLPSLSEQTAIATYLDKKCAEIDNVIAEVEHQIDLLKEYKQSVITEAVTGRAGIV